MPSAPRADRWFFDAWAHVYDFPLVQWTTYRPVHDAVVEAVLGFEPPRILDVGCGTGQLAARLRRELPGAHVTGCDFSGGMLRSAAGRSHDTAWVQAEADRLPFRQAAFDAVVCTEAFHWFPDQDGALDEFRRVLAPGGRAVIALVNPVAPVLSELMRSGSRLLGEPFYWPTSAGMRDMMEHAGFLVRSQRRIFRLPGVLLFPAVLTIAATPD